MHSFDSLSLKYFLHLNYDYLKNSSVQKVQQPSRREFILSLRNNSQTKKLYININPKYPHICFLNENTFQMRDLKIPKSPPMFCMQLRKYVEGSRIKEICVVDYERILELYFEVFDEIGQLIKIVLAIEIMGKHSNVILYNQKDKNILGVAHNISAEKSSYRELYGGISYILPPKQYKTDILKTSYGTFCTVIDGKENSTDTISNHYFYFSKPIAQKVSSISNNNEELFKHLQETASFNNNVVENFWGENGFNQSLDEYFANHIFKDIFSLKSSNYKRIVKKEIKKLGAILQNKPDEKKALAHKEKGDLIFQYIYLLKGGEKCLNTPCGKQIELDENINASQNAQNYYKLYSKAKGAYDYQLTKYDEGVVKKNYYEEILFNIENSNTFFELEEIAFELEKIGLLKEVQNKKEEKVQLELFEFENYEIYLGKNNKQNDYLISKFSKPNDIWLHSFNCPSSHVLIKIRSDQKDPPPSVLEYAALLVKNNSPMKDSGKASIIYTKRKNLRKPPAAVLGYVTYKHEQEIVI